MLFRWRWDRRWWCRSKAAWGYPPARSLDVFFITSGFLVTASLLARQSTVEFVWARVLRVFPALFVMLVLTVFGLGLFFGSSRFSGEGGLDLQEEIG